MARTQREHAQSGIYHVILRGVNQQDIFEDAEDIAMFLAMLGECTYTSPEPGEEREECLRVYTYCLMTNHVHLLVRELLTDDERAMQGENVRIGISAAMHRLGRKYSMWYNRKYGRTGHLFQDRFNSEPVETNEYFLTCFRYIARNPYKAGMVSDPDLYPWSGWYEYLHPSGICYLARESVLSKWSLQNLSEYVHSEVGGSVMDFEDKPRPVTDSELKVMMRELCGGDTVSYMQQLPKEVCKNVAKQMRERGAGWKQISRMTGLTVPVIRGACGYIIPSHRK